MWASKGALAVVLPGLPRSVGGVRQKIHQEGKGASRQRDEKGDVMTTKARLGLSPQQLTIMQLSWDGLTIKETAMQMGLSDKTVKNYRNNIYEKLGVSNVEGMLRQGVERGFLTISSRVQEWP
jgi:DNA-binding NarL/FixJ family response regulator